MRSLCMKTDFAWRNTSNGSGKRNVSAHWKTDGRRGFFIFRALARIPIVNCRTAAARFPVIMWMVLSSRPGGWVHEALIPGA